MLHVIGIKNCNKIRDTRKWLEEREVDYEFVDVKKEPLSREEVKELAFKVGLDVLVNKRGTTYRNLGLKDKEVSEEAMIDLLVENQSMIKRPVLVQDHAVLVGYDEDAFEAFVLSDQEEEA